MDSEIIVAICPECGVRAHLRLWPEKAFCLTCRAAWCRCCKPPVPLPPVGAGPCPAPLGRRA